MPFRRMGLAAMVLLSLFAMGACSFGGSKDEPTETPSLAPAQPLPPDFEAVLQQVAAVRELPAPGNLKVGFVTRSQVVALMESVTTEDDRRWFATTTTLYRLLGHLGQDQDYESVYNSFGSLAVLGLYSPLNKTLWVVSDEPAPAFGKLPAQEKETLAHELVHAVQDANFDVVKLFQSVSGDLDAGLAWTALAEGDAQTHQQRWSDKYLAVPIGRGAGRAMLFASAASMQGVPAAIARELLFPYTAGADWVGDLRARTGTAGLNALFRSPPRSTSYVLHPELLASEWKAAQVSLPDLSGVLGKGFARESGGTFGEFQVRNWLQSRMRALDAANAAAGWGGDHYDVYVNGGESVAVFRMRFRDDAEARQFAEAQQALIKASNATVTPGDPQLATAGAVTMATAALRGSDVLFTLATSPELAKRALEALLRG
ncbi:MAG: hypothetical protein IT302_10900 [Dehalococcoidia bacterium]|nr:hypothetical protein [Dehalococcoidia bacterium]